MKIEHFAVSSNTEEDSDRFFIELLDMKKERAFVVTEDLMKELFKIKKEQRVIRYQNEDLRVEVFITDDNNKLKDSFAHVCIVIEDREKLIEKAKKLNFEVNKVPRKNTDGFYLFLKDHFGNLYEIK